MDKLGVDIGQNNIPSMELVECLAWLDGPLVSLMRDDDRPEQTYIRMWIDSDDERPPITHRYLTFAISNLDAIDYKGGSISLREVLLRNPSSHAFVEDVSSSFIRAAKIRISDIPSDILPSQDSFLDIGEGCP